jgi:hypothetical protein
MRHKFIALWLVVSSVAGQPLTADAQPLHRDGAEVEYGARAQQTQATLLPPERRICESGHRVEEVYDDGRLIELEDGSLWEIDVPDQTDTILWLPTTDITVCPDRLVNTDDDEAAGARRFVAPNRAP